MKLPKNLLMSVVVLVVALTFLLSFVFLKNILNEKNPNISLLENTHRQIELSQSKIGVHFFSSVKGISLRRGDNSDELKQLLLNSKIFGKKIALIDEEQNTGGFEVQRVIFELVDTPQVYYEQKYPGELEPSVSFGLSKYDDQTLLVKIALKKTWFTEMSSQELSWMLYTRAQEMLKNWEYRERFASLSEFTLQKQEDAALIQTKTTELFNAQGLEAFPAVVIKASK